MKKKIAVSVLIGISIAGIVGAFGLKQFFKKPKTTSPEAAIKDAEDRGLPPDEVATIANLIRRYNEDITAQSALEREQISVKNQLTDYERILSELTDKVSNAETASTFYRENFSAYEYARSHATKDPFDKRMGDFGIQVSHKGGQRGAIFDVQTDPFISIEPNYRPTNLVVYYWPDVDRLYNDESHDSDKWYWVWKFPWPQTNTVRVRTGGTWEQTNDAQVHGWDPRPELSGALRAFWDAPEMRNRVSDTLINLREQLDSLRSTTDVSALERQLEDITNNLANLDAEIADIRRDLLGYGVSL
jgi:hypothetical protein